MLNLPDVTLIAISSVNLENTQRALLISSAHIDYGAIKMLSPELPHKQHQHIQYVKIPNLNFNDYSRFLLEELHKYVDTPYCLVVQYDGFVINPQNWSDEFLAYDYIGAPWGDKVTIMPINRVINLDKNRVGNGGFSLRSKKLLEVTAGLRFNELNFPLKSEDFIICHFLYNEMRGMGIRFAPPELAAHFSIESSEGLYGQTLQTVFGFHGKHWLAQ